MIELMEKPISDKAGLVLEAARAIFLERGYALASTDLIQKRAGVSKATIYAHYVSKAALFAAVIGAECQKFSHLLSEDDIESLPIREILYIRGQQFLSLVNSDTAIALFRIVIAEAPRFPELGQAFYEAGPLKTANKMQHYLDLGVRRGELHIPDTAIAAESLLQNLCGFMHLRQLLGIALPTDQAMLQQKVTMIVDDFLKVYRA